MREHQLLKIPSILRDGRYKLGKVIGQGGMAVVVIAHDTELGVDRAAKLLAPHATRHQSSRRRLRAEAKAMARLQHPNILSVHDVGTEGDIDWVVMDLALGGSLHDLLETGPMDPWLASSFMLQVLSALASAHKAGIVHRDVKPHNVLLDEGGRAMLADFGIALLADEDRRTRTGVAMGSLSYMPPEQRLDASRVTMTADLYAVGSSLYSLVSGRNPVDLFLAGDGSPRWDPIPAPLRPVLAQATKMNPDERFQTAPAFANALLAAIEAADIDLTTYLQHQDFNRRGASIYSPTAGTHEGGAGRTHVGGTHAGATHSGATQAAVDRLQTVSDDPPPVLAPPEDSTLGGPDRDQRNAGVRLVAAVLLLLLGFVATTAILFSPSDLARTLSVTDDTSPVQIEPSAPPDPVQPVDTDRPEPIVEPKTTDTPPPASPTSAPVPAVEPTPPPSPTVATSPVSGAWRGSVNGLPIRLTLSGPSGRIRGEGRSSSGGNEERWSIAGSLEDGRLRLSDTNRTPAATYELQYDGRRLTGTLNTSRGSAPISLRRR